MKNILLPTDFSKNSWNAIFFALKLFKDVSCNFYVVNTYDPDPKNVIGARTYVRTGMIIDALAESSQQGLEKMQKYIDENSSNPNHKFEFVSLKGAMVDSLQNFRKQKDIDYIVMGTLGATGAKGVFMGTNSVRMVKAVRNCPLLLVPNEYDLQRLERIVFPTDFSNFYDKYELIPLVELAKMDNASCQVVYLAQEFSLNDEQKRNKKILQERLSELNVSFHEIELTSKLAKGIKSFAEKHNADLIAIVHYRHTFLEKLNREPVVKKVAFHAKVPLLILPELS